jgi:hypothetical protein
MTFEGLSLPSANATSSFNLSFFSCAFKKNQSKLAKRKAMEAQKERIGNGGVNGSVTYAGK